MPAFTDADVVIIGGGIMALSTAFHLYTLAPMKIIIVEREPVPGGHTTTRCAGGFRHQFSDPTNILLSLRSAALIRQYSCDTKCNIPFTPCGYSFLLTEEEASAYEKIVLMQRSLGVPVKLLSRRELEQLLPMMQLDGLYQGTFYEKDGLLDVNSLLRFYRESLRQRVRFMTGAGALSIHALGKRYEVATDKEVLRAPVVVNAAGPWAAEVGHMIGAALPVQPSLQQLLVADNVPWMSRQFPVVIIPSEELGFHSESGGIMSGLTKPLSDRGFQEKGVDREWEIKHCRYMIQRIPSLKESGIVSRWSGYYEMTPDGNPLVGAIQEAPGCYVIAGFCGHGVMHAPACGEMISQLIVTGKSEIDGSALCLDRFQNAVCGQRETMRI